MHDWIPTFGALCRQGRAPSALCPRCLQKVETSEHVRVCQDETAVRSRRSSLTIFLETMVTLGTPIYIISIFEYKLSLTLDIPYISSYSHSGIPNNHTYYSIIKTVPHQNTIEWDNFLRGFTSNYRVSLFD